MSQTSSSAAGAGAPAARHSATIEAHGAMPVVLRIFALSAVTLAFVFVLNAYFVFWVGWPGFESLLGEAGLFGYQAPAKPLGASLFLALGQVLVYVAAVAVIAWYVVRTRRDSLHHDAETLSRVAAYIARAAFWSVLMIGIVDSVISFVRVEGFLPDLVGTDMAQQLGRSVFRGEFVHLPLVLVGMVIAYFSRALGFIWLALMVVLAELSIVILRFIFSYEQAFLADLVRFWYAALFLFSSAYTLLHEGHVRVDVLYTNFSERKKAWVNAIGAIVLGLPVCWIILTMGLSNKFASISAPLLTFEVTQSGFGLYVKYLLAAFLLVYSLSMMAQFMSSLLNSAGTILHEPDAEIPVMEEQHV
jgi:TRAP-type mannitol/chloroaromatic compound transport system permease small subunit